MKKLHLTLLLSTGILFGCEDTGQTEQASEKTDTEQMEEQASNVENIDTTDTTTNKLEQIETEIDKKSSELENSVNEMIKEVN